MNAVRNKPVLSLREPHVENLLDGLPLGGNRDDVRRFCKWLTVQRSRWDVERRKAGLFGVGALRRADADAALKRALAALKGGVL